MTTFEGCVNGLDPSLEDLPLWKKELILKRRANVRLHGGLSMHGPTPSCNPPSNPPRPQRLVSRSVKGNSQSTSSLQGPPENLRSLSGTDHPQHCKQFSSNNAVSLSSDGAYEGGFYSGSDVHSFENDLVSNNINVDMHHKGLYNGGPGVATYPSLSNCEDEDLSYGPGIVSKLKNRYLSLAMRETRSRPALRKFSSLEDLLDADDSECTWSEKNKSVPKVRGNITSPPGGKREAMKRTRSMDSLSFRNNKENNESNNIPKSKSTSSRLNNSVAASLGKEDIIIIERQVEIPHTRIEEKLAYNHAPQLDTDMPMLARKAPQPPLTGEEELPPPDTVKQVKQLFEVRQVRGTAAKVAVYKANQAAKTNGVSPVNKPALKTKPVGLSQRKPFPSPPIHQDIDGAKSKLKQVPQVSRPSPRSTLGSKSPLSPVNYGLSDSFQAPLSSNLPGLTPVTASVTAPLVNGPACNFDEGAKKVSSTALSNIRNDSLCQEFNFTSQSTSPRAVSPTPKTLPPSPVPAHRVAIPSAFKSNNNIYETQRVQHENWKNVEKSKSGVDIVDTNKSDIKPLYKVDVNKSPKPPSEPLKSSNNSRTNDKNNVNKSVRSENSKENKKSKQKPVIDNNVLILDSGSNSSGSDHELIEAINKPTANEGMKGSLSGPKLKQSTGLRDKWHQQENTSLVFNFLDKKETPDYIEDDGIIRTKRRPEVCIYKRDFNCLFIS